jgi:hypothetical protein
LLLKSLAIIDTVLCFCVAIISIGDSVTGGFPWGLNGCLVVFIVVYFCCFVSINTLTIIALERFLSVVKGIILSETTINYLILTVWLSGIATVSIPFIANTYLYTIVLENSATNCIARWTAEGTPSLLLNYITVLVYVFGYIFMIFGYYQIYRKFTKARNPKKLNNPKYLARFDEQQRKVVTMCVMLSGSFIVHWSPYCAKVLYEVITRKETNEYWTMIGVTLGFCKSAFNPFLMFKYDNRIKSQVYETLIALKLAKRRNSDQEGHDQNIPHDVLSKSAHEVSKTIKLKSASVNS